jgi:hypothetical protein
LKKILKIKGPIEHARGENEKFLRLGFKSGLD